MVDQSTQYNLGGQTLLATDIILGVTEQAGQNGSSAAGLNANFGSITPGTAAASKAVVLDSGSKVSGINQITFGAGTATVAPVVLTSGTNLTTAAAGAIEFDGKAFYATSVASSRQLIPAEQRIQLTSTHDLADASIASATAFFVATGAATGAVTLAATTGYEFEAWLMWTNTGTTSHTWSTLFGGTVGITNIAYTVIGASTVNGAAITTQTSQSNAATALVTTAASTSATETVSLTLRGILLTSTAGTLIPQILASARPGQTGTPGVTAGIGSYFRIWPIGSASTIVTGNWS